jgi:hypothetical protein
MSLIAVTDLAHVDSRIATNPYRLCHWLRLSDHVELEPLRVRVVVRDRRVGFKHSLDILEEQL